MDRHAIACQSARVRGTLNGFLETNQKETTSMKPYLQILPNQYTHAIPAALLVALAPMLHQGASAAVLAVDLGAASDFAVVAGAGITVAGAVHSTAIIGDIGSFSTTTITGLENIALMGMNHLGDSVTQQAKTDLGVAFADAAGRTPNAIFSPIFDLGGLTLGAGVYNDPSSLWLTGNLTLDAGGDPNAVWIFQAGSTLITGSGSSISLIGGAQASNVFWQVGSSATLGTGSYFVGSILASESISLNTGAELVGRALAQNGAVTLDYNSIIIPEPGSSMLFGLGMILSVVRRHRVARKACHRIAGN